MSHISSWEYSARTYAAMQCNLYVVSENKLITYIVDGFKVIELALGSSNCRMMLTVVALRAEIYLESILLANMGEHNKA